MSTQRMTSVRAHDARGGDGPARERAADGLYAAGHWLLAGGRYEAAADVLRVGCAVRPEDERMWLGLGAAHEGAGQRHLAKEVYAVGVAVSHRTGRCELALGRALESLGDSALADEAYERAEAAAEREDDAELSELLAWRRRLA